MADVFNIKVVTSQQEFFDAMQVRRAVFVDEQKIDETLEFDGNDFNATHMIAYVGKIPVGTMRIRYFKDFVKLERACVLKDFRKSNISEMLMDSVLKFCAQKGYEKAQGICKKELLPRWKEQGFFPIEGGKIVCQNGMTLIPVEKKIAPTKNCITIQTSMDILNRVEGEWFEDCYVENTNKLFSKEQVKRLKALTESVKNLKLVKDQKVSSWQVPFKYDFFEEMTAHEHEKN